MANGKLVSSSSARKVKEKESCSSGRWLMGPLGPLSPLSSQSWCNRWWPTWSAAGSQLGIVFTSQPTTVTSTTLSILQKWIFLRFCLTVVWMWAWLFQDTCCRYYLLLLSHIYLSICRLTFCLSFPMESKSGQGSPRAQIFLVNLRDLHFRRILQDNNNFSPNYLFYLELLKISFLRTVLI